MGIEKKVFKDSVLNKGIDKMSVSFQVGDIVQYGNEKKEYKVRKTEWKTDSLTWESYQCVQTTPEHEAYPFGFKAVHLKLKNRPQKENVENIMMEDSKVETLKQTKITKVIKQLEKDMGHPIWRPIKVMYDSKENKVATLDLNKLDPKTGQPYCCERNNMTIEGLQKERDEKGWLIERLNKEWNTMSIYLKHIPKLFVIDFDTKELQGCKLKDYCDENQVGYTETKKGFHYYVMIPDIGKFSDQQKVGIQEEYEIDLIKKNNIWETNDRMFHGEIKTIKWEELKPFFNIKKMNFEGSPPVSPMSSDSETIEDDEVDDEVDDEWKDVVIETGVLPTCDKDEFIKHLQSFKPRYDYHSWLVVGMICYNNFEGREEGLKLWNQYSRDDEDGYKGIKDLKNKWETFNGDGKKISYKQFLRWNAEDFPPKNKFEGWYRQGIFMEEMNKICMYYTPTGDILYFSNGIYTRTKSNIACNFYGKYSFKLEEDDKNLTNPFKLWFSNIDRKDVDRIVFNPKGDCAFNEFNIWKGFDYKKTGEGNPEKIQKWLDHIKHIWADDDEDTYEYILNWFARILQQPWKKNNICLVLHSIEGVGKSFILDMIGKIIGKDYYYSTSSLKHILGDFNGDAEAKILVNLNETTWGGDKKMVGAFKEFITDNTIVINKKGIQSYTIQNYANTIITTNEDWIIAVNGQDRRFNLRECKNVKYENEYYEEILKTDLQELANFLYSRDITQYDPKKFEKSELHKEQVERNMDTVETFWRNAIEGEFSLGNWRYDCEMEEWTDKSELYNRYKMKTSGTHSNVVNQVVFWKKTRKIIPSLELRKANSKRKACYKLPLLEVAEKDWNTYMGS